jgi:single-strand selective monofunctional uracil DNA glycosylase
MDPLRIARELSRAVDKLEFSAPVAHVYNPLSYARVLHDAYLERWAKPGVEALLLGMNPGPWGMVQTGVPFGEVAIVRDWMGLEGKVKRPKTEHPKRPIQGLDCERSEVSGRRIYGWAQERFGSADAFFERFFVWNFCPLAFLEEGGKNRTPDKLPAAERDALWEPCDRALRRIVDHVQPELLIGIGRFATDRLGETFAGQDRRIETILHPSPASPIANRGWAPQAEKQLEAMGVSL